MTKVFTLTCSDDFQRWKHLWNCSKGPKMDSSPHPTSFLWGRLSWEIVCNHLLVWIWLLLLLLRNLVDQSPRSHQALELHLTRFYIWACNRSSSYVSRCNPVDKIKYLFGRFFYFLCFCTFFSSPSDRYFNSLKHKPNNCGTRQKQTKKHQDNH